MRFTKYIDIRPKKVDYHPEKVDANNSLVHRFTHLFIFSK